MRRRQGARRIAAVMVGAWLPVATGIPLADAQAQSAAVAERRFTFNVPAQSVPQGLNAIGRVAGLSVVVSGTVPSSVRGSAVSGSLTAGQALSAFLAGTGLTYSFTNANTVTVSGYGGGSDAAASVEGAIALDTIDVTGGRNASSGSGYQGTPDWVYETPAGISVVSREAIQSSSARNARDLLDNVAGVYANRAEAQNPGIAINIRGLQDQDRIVTMIDGARQSFQRGGHGVTQRTYVDTAFVRGIEIEKSSTSGVGSLGSLGGSVNFRTIIADDLIEPGRSFGTEFNGTTGTNGYDLDGSVATALRFSDSFSILGGISRRSIGPYDVGKNGEITNHDTTATGGALLFSGQEVMSTILKAEADITDEMKLTLGWVRNNSDFSTGNYSSLLGGILLETRQEVINDTFTAAFDWNPGSDLIDLKARLYYNHVDNDDFGLGADPRNYIMGTLGGSIENTSRFGTPLGALSLNYGAEAFRDDAESNMPLYIVDGVDQSDFRNGGTPSGKRDVAGGFVNATLEHGAWLTVQGGVRYDWYQTSGSTTIYGNPTVIRHEPSDCRLYYPGTTNCRIWGTPEWWETIPAQPHEVDIDRSEGAFLPTMTVAVKPYDWLQPFVKYSKSFRPPTVMETFLASGHVNDGINMWAPNPYLEPERGDTWELGANVSQNGLFTPDDSLRLKVVGFHRDVENYIALANTWNEQAQKQYQSPVNIDEARMKGVEVEANYDARSWYIGGTLTYNKSDWSPFYTFQGPDGPVRGRIGPSTAVIFIQPEIRYAIDGGVRLFDEKLTFGGRMTYVGETDPTIGTLQNNYKLPEYRIYDLYGSYAFNEHAKLRFNVTNLTDEAYVSALGADYYAMPGRTITGGLHVKF